MKICMGLLMAGISVIACYGYAQERAAAGSVETQVTWTALSDMAKAAGVKADAVNSRVDQVVVCGRKGMVYAPSQAGADAQGCYEVHTVGGVALTTINNSLTGNTTNISSIISCTQQGKVFNGTACVSSTPSAVTCTYTYTSKMVWPDGPVRKYYGGSAFSDCIANAPDSSWMAAGYDVCSEDQGTCSPDGLLCLYARPTCK